MLTPSTLPQVGDQVTYQGETYTVRSVDGNVLELEYHTGRFARFAHVSNVTACPSPATNTAASLPDSAAGSGDLAGMAWYNSQTEEMLRFWHGIAGSAAPVDAWIAYRDTAGNDCSPPATNTAASLPAPAAGQGEGTRWLAAWPIRPETGAAALAYYQAAGGRA